MAENIYSASADPALSYIPGKLLPIKSGLSLLSSPQHQAYLRKLKGLSGLPNAHFLTLYELLVRRFAEYAQILPRKLDGPLGSLLSRSLQRAYIALQTFVDKEPEAELIDRYVIYTAILFQDISCIMTNHSIFLTDEQGVYQSTWSAMKGPLSHFDDAAWYKIIPLKADFRRLRDPLTAMLAQTILPKEGLEWLSSDWRIFVEWLDALCTAGLAGGHLSHILRILKDEWTEEWDFDLTLEEFSQEDSPETEIADAFFQWLDKKIASKELNIGGDADSDIFVLEDGLFLEQRVVEKFARLYDCPHQIVFYQIGNLFGIAKKGGSDFRFDQFFKKSCYSLGGRVVPSASTVKGIYISSNYLKASGPLSKNIKLQGKPIGHDLPGLSSSKRGSLRLNRKTDK